MNYVMILRNTVDGKVQPRKNCWYFFQPGSGNKAARRVAKQLSMASDNWHVRHPWMTAASPIRRNEAYCFFRRAVRFFTNDPLVATRKPEDEQGECK